MKVAGGIVILGAAVNASVLSGSPLEREYAGYLAQFRKSYLTVEEYELRFEQWAKTHHEIHAHNMQGHSWSLGHNHLSDWTAAEKKLLTGFVRHARDEDNVHVFDTAAALPASKDWRNLKAVANVKDQGKCGSCWAFSSTGSIESNTEIATGKFDALSEQQIVDCSWWDNGCNGGNFDSAFAYAAKNGLQGESTYPYKAADGKCAFDATKVLNHKTVGHLDIASYDPKQMKFAINHGPVSIAIEADQTVFQHYSSGVIANNGACGENLDHAVLAVGYGTEDGKDYFLVKNSWGPTWGDAGFVKLEHNSWSGACGVVDQPSIVKVDATK